MRYVHKCKKLWQNSWCCVTGVKPKLRAAWPATHGFVTRISFPPVLPVWWSIINGTMGVATMNSNAVLARACLRCIQTFSIILQLLT